jgi:hypothetical protein
MGGDEEGSGWGLFVGLCDNVRVLVGRREVTVSRLCFGIWCFGFADAWRSIGIGT